jgi:hypothetical protein
VDKPKESAGQTYNIRDEQQYTQRQTVEFIARHMKRDVEVVELPPSVAAKVYKGEGAAAGGGIEFDITKIKTQLGYRDAVSSADALAKSVDWLVANRPEPGGEIERQIGDPFAYETEDELVELYQKALSQLQAIEFPELRSGHMYRHPKKPGEAWAPPSH